MDTYDIFDNNSYFGYETNNSTQLFASNDSINNTTYLNPNNNTNISNLLTLANNNLSDHFFFLNDYYNYYNSKNLSKNLWIYLSPCIFFTGLIGNILILIVMASSHLHSNSTCTYLKAMAVADLFTLVTGMIPEWLDYMGLIILKVVEII